MELKKENVAIRLTEKNITKVYGILKMFKEPIYHKTEERLSNSILSKLDPYLGFSDGSWCGFPDFEKENLKIIKPKQLRNILFAEHCKEGLAIVVKSDAE